MSIEKILQTLEWGSAPESSKMTEEFMQNFGSDQGIFINGKWQNPEGCERFNTTNPANGEVLATIIQSGQKEVDSAVMAAREAQPKWAALSGHERAKYLYAIARNIQKHSRLLAVLETLDNGKPIRESRDIDVPLMVRHFYHHAGWAQIMDETHPNHEPIGVCGSIIPWNFPLLMLSWKIAPALAAGNTIILKPAEYTSLSALAFAEICRSVGLPQGVLNIITGDGRTGAAIVEHEGIDKVAFTGSTGVGRIIRNAIAGTGKGLTLELGGKSPYIVFEDADIDSAVEGLVNAIWFNQGQVCCAGSRLLVQENIAEKFHDKLRLRMSKLRLGNPMDKAIDMGAIVDESQLAMIAKMCKEAEAEGLEMWQADNPLPQEGLFFPPTLFSNVAPSSTIAQEEVFGPVLVSLTFRSPSEAIALANNTRYGLAGSVWSQDIDTALEVARSIKAGTIWVNCTNQFDANSGFGGYRESGFGREGGIEGLWAYMRSKPSSNEKSQREYMIHKSQSQVQTSPSEGARGTSLDQQDSIVNRTTKFYIGGKQCRPDGNYCLSVIGPTGFVGEVGRGNRKDIRNAVEAASKSINSKNWCGKSAHSRAQVLFYIGENLQQREDEIAKRISAQTGQSMADAISEVKDSIAEWFRWASWSDKHDGRVHETTINGLVLAVNEPLGVVGLVCPPSPSLFSFTRLLAPLIAMGNSVVAIPSETAPLAALEMYQIFETSDLPAGVVNIVTGLHGELLSTIAEHDAIDAIWADINDMTLVHQGSCGNMKQTWKATSLSSDKELLRRACNVKNIWLPHGI